MSAEPPTTQQPDLPPPPPDEPAAPPPASSPAPNRRPLLLGIVGLLVLVLLILLGVNFLAGPSVPPTGTPQAALATETPPGPTVTEVPASAVAGGTQAPGLPGAVGSVVGGGLPTAEANVPGAVPTAPAGQVPGATASAPAGEAPGGTPAGTGIAAAGATPAGPVRLAVVDSRGTAYACARLQGCSLQAAAGLPVFAGGEARTGPDGRLRLQGPAGLLTLDSATTLRVTGLDAAQEAILLQQGRILHRAAAGRNEPLLVATAAGTITGTGTSFGVVLLPSGGLRVVVPADATRPAHFQPPGGGAAVDVAPGMELPVSATGEAGQVAPISAGETAALTDLTGTPPGTPAAAIPITELPVPSQPPFPTGVVTATIVLSPPPEQTLPPLTVLPLETPAATAVAGGVATGTVTAGGVVTGTVTAGGVATGTVTTGVPVTGTTVAGIGLTPTAGGPPASPTAGPLASPTAVPTPGTAAGILTTAANVMTGVGSYTFGAVQGADPATAEYSAGSVTGDTACWTTTSGAVRSDYQARGGLVFQRAPNGPWQQQAGQAGLPAWITAWRLLAQVDPATVKDLGPVQTDPITIRHLRARLLPAAGLPGPPWVEAFVSEPDYLVRGLVRYDGDPAAAGTPTSKITYSSFGSAPACPPLNP